MEEQVKRKSGLATAGLVLGIVGIVLSFIPIIRFVAYPLAALSFIFGLIPLIGKKSIGKAVAAIVLGIATLISTVVMQAATVKAVDTAINTATDSLNDMTGDNTDALLKNDVDVTIGEFKIVKGDYFDSYKLPVTVKNKGKEKASFLVKVEAVDKNGERIEDDSVSVDTLNAGQSQSCEAFTLITSETAKQLKSATFKVVEVSKF
ncbi:MAG: hypothetical protein MJ090_06055 [Clostridia bacterium]|nr:hypothetical protein [Clostridia bacterium]